MWSDPEAGFEASPYSRAGESQREWWFIRRWNRLTWRDREQRAATAARLALPAVAVFVVAALSIGLLTEVLGGAVTALLVVGAVAVAALRR